MVMTCTIPLFFYFLHSFVVLGISLVGLKGGAGGYGITYPSAVSITTGMDGVYITIIDH